MNVGKYKLEYQPKIDRAIERVGENPQDVLVEYDRLGGYITLNGEKVKTGSFYDAKKGVARTKPEVVVLKKARAATEEVIEEETVEEEAPKKRATKKASSK